MKYYKNLVKRKKYMIIILSIIITLLGLSCVFLNFINIVVRGIEISKLPPNMIINNKLIGIIGCTNFGMLIIGILVIYIGAIFIPKVTPYSQNDSDYIIKFLEDNIYIKYKNSEYLVKKETFNPSDLFFKDKNKKFVSITRAYQIYNYVQYNYKTNTI